VLREPLPIHGVEEAVTGSIGIALATGGGDAETLLRDADSAMYRAKQGGRDRFEVSER
jgi:PleD family two-component response regulator